MSPDQKREKFVAFVMACEKGKKDEADKLRAELCAADPTGNYRKIFADAFDDAKPAQAAQPAKLAPLKTNVKPAPKGMFSDESE